MKKIMPIILAGVLILGGLGAVALHDKQYETELITNMIVISEPEITDIDDYVRLKNIDYLKKFNHLLHLLSCLRNSHKHHLN